MRFEWSVDSAILMQKCVTSSMLLVKSQILLAYETVDFFFPLSVEGNNICDVQKPLRASDILDTPLGADSRLNFDEISLEWNIEWIFVPYFSSVTSVIRPTDCVITI